MFGKFFKGDKKDAPPPKPVQPDQGIQHEKILHEISQKLDKMDEEMERIEMKTTRLDTQIRELMAQKKKDQAKAKIAEMKGYQKQLENYQTKRNALTQMKIQIENVKMDSEMGNLIIDAGNIMKSAQEQNEKVEEALMDFNESVQQQQQTQELWKQMAGIGVDENDLEDEFAKYEQENNAEQVQKMNNVMQNVPNQQIHNPQPQVQQQQQYTGYQQKQDQAFQSNVQALLE